MESRLIPPEEAIRFCNERNFTIRDNQFMLDNSSGVHPAAASVISHLGTIFDRFHVEVQLDGGREGLVVVVRAVNVPEFVSAKALFVLGFAVLPKQALLLATINSNQPGLGGKSIAMLYNLAKELGVRSINFSVNDIKAAQFYFHTDFGAPMDAESMLGDWKLPII